MDWLTLTITHNNHDAFWQKRDFTPHLGNIKIPVLQNAVWYDHFIRGSLAGFEGVAGPKRLLIAPGGLGAPNGDGEGGLLDLQVRWFDYFLRGNENGVMDEPTAHYYLLGEERWVDEAWPVPTTDTTFYFASGSGGGANSINDGLLSLDGPGGSPDTLVHDPANPNHTPAFPGDQRSFEPMALTFSTPPLEQDVEVIGASQLILYASTDAKDVDWLVRLCDVYPDGRARVLNFGALKGSHVMSHEFPVDLERERVYEFNIEVWATANVFKKGHRIRIDVCNSDYPCFASNPLPSRNQVFHDAQNPSRLIMPVVKR
jgi:putative CocE/NonD family hydrolase